MWCIAKGPENQQPLGTRSSSSRGVPGVHGPRKPTAVSLGYRSDVWKRSSVPPSLLALSQININIYIYIHSLYFFLKWLTGPNFSIQRLTPCKRDWKLRVCLYNSVFSDRPERFERMDREHLSAQHQQERYRRTSRIRARPAAQLNSLVHQRERRPG